MRTGDTGALPSLPPPGPRRRNTRQCRTRLVPAFFPPTPDKCQGPCRHHENVKYVPLPPAAQETVETGETDPPCTLPRFESRPRPCFSAPASPTLTSHQHPPHPHPPLAPFQPQELMPFGGCIETFKTGSIFKWITTLLTDCRRLELFVC